ncbi:DUF6524 family protein [Marivita sp. XM-24bin2]|jgi:hypothetical protein|uniref:DUF6524 family protein n=1 Tax=unclassified Marivita TaxID=2632480 RepID=UPI000D7B16C8|nr:DUF6524 family protein [Marivita sp. XM-24bin2]MCR9107323.1 DUF6524 family protein [Paracoccaceae bacterium]PWL36556.1 MAG: hypothetical protein DCO97_03490 [Marivita sp. XM-24bin2]
MGFFLRWLFAFALVAATYNPTPYNFARWAMTDGQEHLSVTVLAGLVLLVGYIIYLRATLRSIGAFGMILILALVGALLWVAFDFGFLDLQNRTLSVWLGILALSLVLGIGLSWSIIRRKLSGQADVDDVEE